MYIMKIRIKRKSSYTIFLSILYVIMLFVYAPIESIYHYYPSLWSIIGKVSIVFTYLIPFIAFLGVKKKNLKLNKLSYGTVLGAYILVLILSTIINNGALVQAITFALNIINFTLIEYLFIKKDADLFIDLTLAVLWVYTVINLITVLQSPNGMYASVMSNGSYSSLNWFLGYKNSFLPYYYYAAVVGCAAVIIRKSRIFVILNYSMIAIMEIALIKVDAVTSFVGIMCVLIASLAIKIIKNLRISISFVSMAVNGVIFAFLIVMYRVAPIISYVVTYYFNRDLTFSNRRIIWDKAIEAILKKPLLGNGYQLGTDVVKIIGMQHTHNMYLWQLYRGGILLGIIFIVLIYLSLKKSENSSFAELGKFLTCALSVILIMWQFEVFGDSILLFGVIYFVFNIDGLYKKGKLVDSNDKSQHKRIHL